MLCFGIHAGRTGWNSGGKLSPHRAVLVMQDQGNLQLLVPDGVIFSVQLSNQTIPNAFIWTMNRESIQLMHV